MNNARNNLSVFNEAQFNSNDQNINQQKFNDEQLLIENMIFYSDEEDVLPNNENRFRSGK